MMRLSQARPWPGRFACGPLDTRIGTVPPVGVASESRPRMISSADCGRSAGRFSRHCITM